MRPLIIFLAIVALAACGDRTERTQQEIKEGIKDGQRSEKKVKEALKQGEAARREGDGGRYP